MNALSQQLARIFGRRHCVLTGHGSTAIYLALKAVAARRGTGDVLVPTIGCPSIVQTILYAGFTPRYVDINLDDYTIDIASLRAAITTNARVILPIHLYGHACAMDEILALAREHELVVLEDAAQSLGGTYNGRPLGSIGDFSLLSFGGTKIVAAGAGGALLFDDDDAAEVVERELAAMPEFDTSPQYALASLSHRNLYHGVVDYLRLHPETLLDPVWKLATPLYRDLYLHRFPSDPAYAEKISCDLQSLDQNLAARLRRAERYHEKLAALPVRRSESWKKSGSVWRYTFLLSAPDVVRVGSFLRKNGVHVSHHYWSMADVFTGDKSLPNTAEFQTRVMNFWVDDIATDEYIDRCCALLAEGVSQAF